MGSLLKHVAGIIDLEQANSRFRKVKCYQDSFNPCENADRPFQVVGLSRMFRDQKCSELVDRLLQISNLLILPGDLVLEINLSVRRRKWNVYARRPVRHVHDTPEELLDRGIKFPLFVGLWYRDHAPPSACVIAISLGELCPHLFVNLSTPLTVAIFFSVSGTTEKMSCTGPEPKILMR